MAAFNFPSSPTAGQIYSPGAGLPSFQFNGTAWINIGSAMAVDTFAYTATGGETTVTVTGGYLANMGIVCRNGAVQAPNDDVNISSGTIIVFATALTAGESILFYKFRAFSLIDGLTKSQNLADLTNVAAARANLGQAFTLVSDQTLIANATQFTDIDISAYGLLRFELEVVPNTAVADFYTLARFSFDGGSTFPAGASEYFRVAANFNAAGSTSSVGNLDGMQITNVIDTASVAIRGQAAGHFRKGAAASRSFLKSDAYANDGSNNNGSGFYNNRNSNGLATHIRFAASVASGLGIGSRLTVEGRV